MFQSNHVCNYLHAELSVLIQTLTVPVLEKPFIKMNITDDSGFTVSTAIVIHKLWSSK